MVGWARYHIHRGTEGGVEPLGTRHSVRGRAADARFLAGKVSHAPQLSVGLGSAAERAPQLAGTGVSHGARAQGGRAATTDPVSAGQSGEETILNTDRTGQLFRLH